MSTIMFREVDSLNREYEEALKNIETGKNIKTGGALVTFPDKERNLCELSATYMVKLGRFSKEQRVVVTLTFKKDSNGVYSANIEDSVFHVVQEEKGGLKEVWSGRLKEAMDKLGDVARLHVNVMSTLSSKSTS
jgi:cytochrome c biogenesis factor